GRREGGGVMGMGVGERLREGGAAVSRGLMASQRQGSDVAGGLGSFGRVFRMLLQSAVLGVGAYLVILQEASAGIIIAASILTGRALAPVDLAIANWKGFLAARQSWQRLRQLLAAMATPGLRLELNPPVQSLAVEALAVAPPGTQKLVAHDINFPLNPGTALRTISPTASAH